MQRSFFKVGMAALMVAGLSVLGACSSDKPSEADLAKQEAAELRERNAALEQETRTQASQIASLQSENAALRAAPAQASNGGGWDTPRGGGNTGGGGNFSEDSRGRMVAEVAGDVLFSSGQATLKPDAKKKLDSIARELNSRYSGNDIRIEGHTDSDRITKSKWASNEALSKARADAVRDYLQSKGVSGGRMATVGKGSSEPKSTKAASRRVDIIILSN